MREGKEKKGGYEMRLSPRAAKLYARESKKHDQSTEHTPVLLEALENALVMQELQNSLDFKELENIFLDMLKKSGVPPEHANTIALKTVDIGSLGKKIVAHYHTLSNMFSVSNTSKYFRGMKKLHANREPIPEQLLMTMQLYVIHEMCHVFGRVRINSRDIKNAQAHTTQEIGYSKVESVVRIPMRPEKRIVGVETQNMLGAFNEGVTQRIAEEVFLEYQKRTGKSEAARKFLASRIRRSTNPKRPWSYYVFGNHVESVCELIARYTDVPKEKVWESIKRGYFEKPELFNQDTVELFKKTFGAEAVHAFSQIDARDSVQKIAQFDAKYNVPPIKTYAKRWLGHLGIQKKRKERKKAT